MALRSSSRGSSSSGETSSRRAPPPAIKMEEPRRTGGVTIRDFGPPAPKTEPASPRWSGGVKIKDEPASSLPPRKQRRGGVAIAAPAPARRELTEEEAKAKYDADIAEAIRRSIDTVQPASVEYAEAWSAEQAGIINVEDSPPPAEVKMEDAPYTVKEEDYDAFYRYR